LLRDRESLSATETLLVDVGDDLRADWRALANASQPGAFFASTAFVDAFASVFGSVAQLSVLTFRDRALRLVGLVPLARSRVWRGPSLSTRYAYLPPDTQFLRRQSWPLPLPVAQISTPLCLEATALRSEFLAAPGAREEILRTIPSALAELPHWNVTLFALDESEATAVAAGPLEGWLHRLDRPMRFLMKPMPVAELITAESKKFRQNVRRSERFSEEAGVVFQCISGHAAVATAMPDFAAVAARSWKRPDAAGRANEVDVLIPYTDAQRRFAETIVASPDVEPLLFSAWLGGTLSAAMLCVRLGNVLTTLLLYTDSAAGRLSLGRLLLHRVIDYASEHGLDAIDWNSNADWTERYSNATSMRHNVILTSSRPGGRLLRGIAALKGNR
jgi:CelD/BcsL family acetyltransferase involved in cellulose biosynthesis